MNLLLDTHVLLWWLADDRRLSETARHAVTNSDQVFVSAASAWEIAIKVARGKLKLDGELEEHLEQSGFRALSVTMAHAVAAAKLPNHHSDPFDRMLAAQAAMESLTLLTGDEKLKDYGTPILFV